jgi:hypothetical protein
MDKDEQAERFNKKFGLMSNEDFFNTNKKGSFYEGYSKDENGNWIKGEELQRKQDIEDKGCQCSGCVNEDDWCSG